MSEIAADLQPACYSLLPQTEIEEFQSLGPDRIPSCACARARDAAKRAPRAADGRFAKGHSGNPQGRPRGIRNPRRRPLGLLLRQARPGALAPLIARKRHLRLPVLGLVLPPRACRPDPGELLGIDFSRMDSADQIAAAIGQAVAAMGRGEIGPGEATRLVRRSRKPLRTLRRRLWRRLARLEAMRRDPKRAGKFPVKSRKIPCSQGISPEPEPARFSLLSATRIEQCQRVGPDLFLARASAREAPPDAARPVRLAGAPGYSRSGQGIGIGASTWRGSRSAGFSTRPTPSRRSAPPGMISSAPTPGPALSAARS